MSNKELHKILKKHGEWLNSNGQGGERADLAYADLCAARLRGAHLNGAALRGANLRGADLSGADLSEADLREANLCEADLCEADLSGADLSGAKLVYTIFANVDLRNVQNLEKVKHIGPSTIGLDTIYKSKGKIPEIFLRGCGVPDNFIEYMHSLTGEAIEFYSCFISYCHKDEEFAKRLHEGLQSEGVRCWFAREDMKAGKKIHEQIDLSIRLHEKLLLILSEESMKSEWVITEIRRAREGEKRENKRKLFPIRLVDMDAIKKWKCFDSDTGKDLAVEIREYFIPDFSNWKDHDSYQEAFKRLLQDLKGGRE